ncbi:MAG TPA: hypothetical protein VGQ38_11740 [Gaiellaceae bacterium]|jgi:hypothetical protein|nr:hypothetical protein [Gaiellaceae bacterium]
MLRKTVFLAAVAALCLSVAVATATAGGGNSGNAMLCQKDGWKNLYKADGTAFTNAGNCVSYAANGGTISTSQTFTTCNGVTCTYSDAASDTSLTAPQGALQSVTFGPPNQSYTCGTAGPSIGSIADYVPVQTSPASQFQITMRYSASEVQAYINQHDHDPTLCMQKNSDSQFFTVPDCPFEGVAQTPCVVNQGFEYANTDVALIPVDYQFTVFVSSDDPRVAAGN